MKKMLLILVTLIATMPFAHGSNDLSFFGLKGNVDSVTITSGDSIFWDFAISGNHMRFNKKGNLLAGELGSLRYDIHSTDSLAVTIKRDEQGRIITIERLDPGDAETAIHHFQYDNKGHLSKNNYYIYETTGNSTYSYNSKGLLSAMDLFDSCTGTDCQVKYLFFYGGFDEHGNWTKVTIHYTSKCQDIGDPEITSDSGKGVVRRKITYYK